MNKSNHYAVLADNSSKIFLKAFRTDFDISYLDFFSLIFPHLKKRYTHEQIKIVGFKSGFNCLHFVEESFRELMDRKRLTRRSVAKYLKDYKPKNFKGMIDITGKISLED
jgi:hypothetical protein